MPNNDPDEHLKLIGEIARNASVLELMVANLIWNLLEAPQERGQAVTNRMGMMQLIGLAKRLLSLSDVPVTEISAAEAALKRAEKLYEHRNRVLHSFWGPSGSDSYIPVSTRTAGSISSERISRQDLKELADQLMECIQELPTLSRAIEEATVRLATDEDE